jgi:hypothetical protein
VVAHVPNVRVIGCDRRLQLRLRPLWRRRLPAGLLLDDAASGEAFEHLEGLGGELG